MTFDDWLSDMTKLVSFARAHSAKWEAFSAGYAGFPESSPGGPEPDRTSRTARCGSTERASLAPLP